MAKRAPEFLREGAETYEQRNKVYGDNYLRFGEVMEALFPHGIQLDSVSDFNRFGVLVQIVGKLSRYAVNFEQGGHADSLLDTMVYASMLLELDKRKQEAES